MADLVCPDDLRALLRVQDGRLFWKERPLKFCENEAHQVRWNKLYAGKETFRSNERGNYLRGCVLGKFYLAHRVIWAIEYGAWPIGQIDHIDGDRQNNKIENLRVVDAEGNQRNRKTPITNKSGYMGIRWVPEKRKWRVHVGKTHIGFYADQSNAVIARDAACRALGYHPNHGRSALIAVEEQSQ